MKPALTRCVRFALCSLLFLAVLFSALWAIAALLLSPLSASIVARLAAAGHGLLAILTLFMLFKARRPKAALLAYCLSFLIILVAFSRLQPSNDRDWQSDVAVLPTARIDGDRVLVRNIRNFSYRSEFDYSPAYYDREFDLNKLDGVDLVSVYWMGPAIAHIFLSFSFSDGQHLAISIETRKEKGEAYSTLKGFFRQYELYYVVADERDVIGLRTNYRENPPEDVYIYRLKGPLENTRRLFLEYMHQLNALEAKPAFYNSLTTNCTTTIWLNAKVNPSHMPFHWSLIATGYLPERLYALDRIDSRGLSFTELQEQVHANARARQQGITPHFSAAIRAPSTESLSSR
jgi:hypothetical protein